MKKTKLLFVLIVVALTLLLSSCDIVMSTIFGDHECQYIEYDREPSTCAERGKVYYVCLCSKEREESLPLADHTPMKLQARPATCELEGAGEGICCAVCSELIVVPERIDKLAHTVVILPATDGSDGKPAKTQGSYCSVCNTVIEKQQFIFADAYSTPESYDGDYAYEYLKTLSNSKALTAFYDLIDAEADYFHSSGTGTGDDYVVASITYSDLGLTTSDAIAVWVAYRMDHPLYYWISNKTTHTSTYLNLIVSEEYADGAVRDELNYEIYNIAQTWIESADATDAYSLSLAFHDIIVNNSYYAYEDDGVTPESDRWAHTVEGIMLRGAGVCESYTKTFQMLLNYCGVENIYVRGYAGEPHAWNLVEIEDGEWYWFDLTWDDTPDFMWGVIYNYFCVTDSQQLGWRDGSYIVPASTFLSSHTPDPITHTGVDFMYSLPNRAASVYDGLLRDEFTSAGFSYAVISSDSVALTGISLSGNVTIPESVEYMGTTYKVSVIGKIENGVLKDGVITDRSISSVSVPKTVEYIFGGALAIEGIRNVIIDPDNSHYTYDGGLLYNIDKSYIHGIVDKNITTLHIGKNVSGWSSVGAAFYNCLDLATVTLDPENPYFSLYGGILYNKEMTRIVLIPRAISGQVVLADTLTELGSDTANASFKYRSKITSIVIPDSVTVFTETFEKCQLLNTVYFRGTQSDWQRLVGNIAITARVICNHNG